MTIDEFLRQYAKHSGISEAEALAIKPDKFGDSPELADNLLALVLTGEKTATCSSVWEWEHENEQIPYAGMKSVILNGNDEPKCVIETISIAIKKYSEVDAQFAYEEGEGDRSLEYWRDAHRRYFTRTLSKIGKEFTEDMPLVCERFKVVFRGEQ
jgi:uncharacterized protein YhfF